MSVPLTPEKTISALSPIDLGRWQRPVAGWGVVFWLHREGYEANMATMAHLRWSLALIDSVGVANNVTKYHLRGSS